MTFIVAIVLLVYVALWVAEVITSKPDTRARLLREFAIVISFLFLTWLVLLK